MPSTIGTDQRREEEAFGRDIARSSEPSGERFYLYEKETDNPSELESMASSTMPLILPFVISNLIFSFFIHIEPTLGRNYQRRVVARNNELMPN